MLGSDVGLQVSRVSGGCYDCMCRLTDHSFCSAGGRLVTARGDTRTPQARLTICVFKCSRYENSEGRFFEGLSVYVTLLVRQAAAVAGAGDDPLCEMCTQFVTDLKTYVSSDQGRAYFTNMINQVNMSLDTRAV